MPKRKAPEPLTPVLATTTRSRRQASKEALKQMQILLDDEDEESETLEIPSDDDDDVPIIRLSDRRSSGVSSSQQKERLSSPVQVKSETHPPPKKKYKLSHRKSSDGNDRDVLVLKSISNHVNTENTLELDCWVEELSEVQKELKKKYDDECKVLEKKIEELVKSSNVSTVHKTDLSSAYEITEPPPPAPPLATSNIILQPQNSASPQSYQLVMDPRLGLIVAGTIPTSVVTTSSTQPPPLTTPSKQQQSTFKGKVQISQAVKAVANATAESDDTPSVRQTRTRTRANRISPVPSPVSSPVTRGSAQQSVLKNVAAPVTKTPVTKISAPVTKTPVPKVTTPVAKTPVSKISIPKQTTSAPVTRLRSGPNSTPPTTQIAQSSSRPAEANVEGGLVAGTSKRSSMQDLADETRGQADSREIAFNKLQGKTYPSLVVVARPHMRVKDLNIDRSKLDTKVKSVLMHPPTKFTEWLIQQGLVRSEQKCSIHTTSQLKLGMYSDVSKFPYSGGYVWISECCPQRFVSVFSGSLFEGSPHPPVVILKLLYHWSCQTNIQNVVQWVKVDNLYVKGLYTWLRSVCTVAIHTHIKQLGGPGAKVEVGVISLGTTSQDGNQRQVKVEVLGILETTTKFIRLRAVEPDTDKNYKKRFSKILEPVMHWVHPSSTIITDLTVDKSTLVSMGFSNVVQSTSVEYGNSNRMIMEYLRQVVPRMFQNTLSLLSRQIIQQFLDELVWREWFGTTSAQAFDNIVIHLAEQTRADLGSSLIVRLNRVAANPFKGWALTNTSNYTVTKAATTNNTAAAPVTESTAKRYTRVRKPLPPQSPSSHEDSPPPPRPVRSVSPDVPEQMVPLENYYYGTIEPPRHIQEKVSLNMKCPFCKLSLNNNIGLMHHLFKHAHNVSGETRLCRYCLTGVPNNTDLMNHIATSHPSETKFDNGFVCLICETQFMNPFVLGKHMSREHCPYELPYQCGSCSYRCSNHKQAIDHFYQCHSNGPAIQCPFCLKSTLLMSGGRYIPQNMNYFIQHLQKHQKKQIAKRCGKCNLWFIQKDLLKEHQTKMHVSQRGKPRLIPWTAPRNCVMVPKSKIDEVPDDELINYSSLHFSVTKNHVCKECDMCLDSPKHLSSFESCSNTNCQYSTCCANAMKKHNDNCKVLNETLPKEPLPYIMFCICGFSSNDGNVLARHLAICEKKSAYPSRAAANKAVVNQSMLDVLGLVRKPEESQTTEDKTEKSKPEAVKKDDFEAEDNEKLSKTVTEMAKKSKSNKEVAVIELDDDDENIESGTDKAQKKSPSEKRDSAELLSDDNKKIVNKKRKSGKHNKQNDEKKDKEPDIEMDVVEKNDDSKENSKSKKYDSEKEPKSQCNTQKSDETDIVNSTEEIKETDTEITKENSSNVQDKPIEKEAANQETLSVQHEKGDIDMNEEAPVIPEEGKAIDEPSESTTDRDVASTNTINEEEASSNQINEEEASSDQIHDEEAPSNQINEEEASSNQSKEEASSNQINGEEASSDQIDEGDASSNQINEEDTSSNQINEEEASSNQNNEEDASSDQINEEETSNKLEEEEASSNEINEEEASSSQINEGTSGEINEEEVPSAEINEENTLLEQTNEEETSDQTNEKDTASCKMNESFVPTENGTEDSTEEIYEAPERNEDNADSVVAQSVLDTLAAECANTAKSSMFNNEEVERMDVDNYNEGTDYNLVESETPMDIN